MQFADELKPVLIDDLGLSDDEDDFAAVNASVDKFNKSSEKDNKFWKNAYKTLDNANDEYDKFVEDSLLKKNEETPQNIYYSYWFVCSYQVHNFYLGKRDI